MLVLLAAFVDIEGGLPGSPIDEPARIAYERHTEQIRFLAGVIGGEIDLGDRSTWPGADQTYEQRIAIAEAQREFRENGEAREREAWAEYLRQGDRDAPRASDLIKDAFETSPQLRDLKSRK